MHLIQILLPLYDNEGHRIPMIHHRAVKEELTERFHGLTAYNRAPAEGLWKKSQKGHKTRRDDIIIYEVMTQTRNASWWRIFRRRLEQRFRQEEVIIRAQEIALL